MVKLYIYLHAYGEFHVVQKHSEAVVITLK